MNSIIRFDEPTTSAIAELLKEQHIRIGQLDRPTGQRSLTARNYDSAIKGLGDYLNTTGAILPTKSILEQWRDDMLAGRAGGAGRVYSVSSVNARLAAIRKLLRAVADDSVDLTIKMVLNDWSKVTDAKATAKQDMTEADYGRRLTLHSLNGLIHSIDTSTIKGQRDRALIAVLAGAGLRIDEAAKLTMSDVFSTVNDQGQRGIRVRKGKHNKSRIVVLNGWGAWVFKAVEAYTSALGLSTDQDAELFVFRGVKREKNGAYTSVGKNLTTRGIERAIEDYTAEYAGVMIQIDCHDLRRTYAKLCKQSGMSWEGLRENMGHSSVTITERYVGKDVDWSERIPNWTIDL